MGRCPFCRSITAIINITPELDEFHCLNTKCDVYPLYYKTVKDLKTQFRTYIDYSFGLDKFWVKGNLTNGAFAIFKLNASNPPLIRSFNESDFSPFNFTPPAHKIEDLKDKIQLYVLMI